MGCFCVFVEWAKSLNQITFNGPFNKAIRVKWFVASSVNTARSVFVFVLPLIAQPNYTPPPKAVLLGPLSAPSWESVHLSSTQSSIRFHSQQIRQAHSRQHLGHIYSHTDTVTLTGRYSCICICLWAQPAYACHIHTYTHIYFSTSRVSPNGIGFIRGPLKCSQRKGVHQFGSEICNPLREKACSSWVRMYINLYLTSAAEI